MKILSVNAGLSRTGSQQGRTIETAIGQSSVAGMVCVRALNLQGDCQADLTAANINRLYTIEKSDFATVRPPPVSNYCLRAGKNISARG